MTIGTPTVHLAGNDDVDATSFNFTAGSTPSAGTRCFAGIRCARAGGGIVPLSFTAFGLTWLQVTSILRTGGQARLTVFEANAGSPSGTSVSVDLNDGGGNHGSCAVIIVSHADAGAAVQSATAQTGSAGALAVTLAAVAAGHGVGYFGATSVVATAWAPEAGYTEASDIACSDAGAARMTYVWRSDNADSTPSATPTYTAGAGAIAVGFEIGVPGTSFDPFSTMGFFGI